jgi:hypothetical protein
MSRSMARSPVSSPSTFAMHVSRSACSASLFSDEIAAICALMAISTCPLSPVARASW